MNPPHILTPLTTHVIIHSNNAHACNCQLLNVYLNYLVDFRLVNLIRRRNIASAATLGTKMSKLADGVIALGTLNFTLLSYAVLGQVHPFLHFEVVTLALLLTDSCCHFSFPCLKLLLV